MRILFQLWAAGLIFTLSVATATADELRLTSGDRYTGSVVRLSAGILTFQTAHGTLTIPWAEVSGLSVNEEIAITTADGTVTLPGATIDLAATTALARPQPPVVITGGVGAGLIASGGNTSVNSLRLDGDAVMRMGENRYTFAGDINRAQDRGVVTAQNWTSSARYDRFLTPRIFVNANVIFTNDRFRDLDLRGAYGAGLGFQVVDRPLVKFNVDAGLGYVNENFDVAEDDSYAAVRESGKADVFLVAERVVLFHKHDGYFGVTGTDNFFVQTENGVRFNLVAGLVTTFRLDVDYDRSPAPDREKIDRTFALTLGYRF